MPGAAERAGGDARVPRLAPGWEHKAADLSPEEGFLLSRIDGRTSWGVLRSMVGLPPEQVDLCLERWLDAGLLELRCAASEGVDPALQIPVGLQRRILAFEAQLDRPYHAILGVERDADSRAIKRAYFQLSKSFHPDRYFRREIGHFGARLDRIFKRVALAYELLMDPTTRSELDRTMREAPPPEPERSSSRQAPQNFSKREWLERMRQRFRVPEGVLAERKLRARQLVDAARVAQRQQQWNEAASSIRLAIAFDPWTEAYKEVFAEIQVGVNQLRAERLLEEARDAWGARSKGEAMRLYEEVLHYRPSDARVHDEVAAIALEVGNLEAALEYAERACELAPDEAGYHLTRGRVLRTAGRRGKARDAFEAARRLDPRSPRIKEELRRLRRWPAPGIGGKR